MSAEQNRKTVLKYMQTNGETNVLDESRPTDDCKWWVPGGIGTMDKAAFKAIMAKWESLLPSFPIMTIVGTAAEGDRVAVEAIGRAKLSDGRVYENTYHFLFQLRDGKICEIKEYMDSKRAFDMFGAA